MVLCVGLVIVRWIIFGVCLLVFGVLFCCVVMVVVLFLCLSFVFCCGSLFGLSELVFCFLVFVVVCWRFGLVYLFRWCGDCSLCFFVFGLLWCVYTVVVLLFLVFTCFCRGT